jgi:fructose-1-phosphate kinase PfkB-like protein
MFKSKIEELIDVLETKNPTGQNAVIGLDGFIDEILHVVSIRKNAQEYERLLSIKEYGERILNAAGLSTNIEMVRIKQKLGGNGPILSNALSTLGVSLTCIGSLGYPHIEKVFTHMPENCKIISISNPGLTDAVEFDDGKLIIGKHENLKEISWDNLKNTIGIHKIIELVNNSKLLGLENWTMIPHMNDIWRGILDEVCPHLDSTVERRFVFFDLADPEKRLKEDILEALNLIKSFSTYFDVILGMNLKESVEIATVLGFTDYAHSNPSDINLKRLVSDISSKLNLYSIVVHPTIEAATIIGESFYHVSGPFTPKPKLTTGAGDNFNAGFCLGQILELTPEQSLIAGVATSGYYVRNAKSPTFKNLIEFLKEWQQDNVQA